MTVSSGPELPKEACDYQAIRDLARQVRDATTMEDRIRMLFVLYWKQASAYNKTRVSYETFLARTVTGSTGLGKTLLGVFKSEKIKESTAALSHRVLGLILKLTEDLPIIGVAVQGAYLMKLIKEVMGNSIQSSTESSGMQAKLSELQDLHYDVQKAEKRNLCYTHLADMLERAIRTELFASDPGVYKETPISSEPKNNKLTAALGTLTEKVKGIMSPTQLKQLTMANEPHRTFVHLEKTESHARIQTAWQEYISKFADMTGFATYNSEIKLQKEAISDVCTMVLGGTVDLFKGMKDMVFSTYRLTLLGRSMIAQRSLQVNVNNVNAYKKEFAQSLEVLTKRANSEETRKSYPKVLARNLYMELTKNTAKHELGNSPGIRNLGKMAYKLVYNTLLSSALRSYKLSSKSKNINGRNQQRQHHSLISKRIGRS